MRNSYTIIILLLVSNALFAQTAQKKCICCTAEYKQFDFWLGDWEVFNLKGVKVGENNVVSMQDSCVIQENWKSAGQTGTSYNFYNKTDSTWNQVYIDNFGTVLELKGNLKDSKMILESQKIKSVKANFYYFNRITWSKDNLGNVSQKWDIVDDKGKILQVAFDGIYKHKVN